MKHLLSVSRRTNTRIGLLSPALSSREGEGVTRRAAVIAPRAGDKWKLPLHAPEGEFMAIYSDRGLCGLSFPKPSGKSLDESASKDVPEQVQAWHKQTAEALGRALVGKDPGKLPPLDIASGTNFQQQVWKALLKIDCGQTRSYGEIAEAIGNPKAVRAVGGACGANPIPVFIPCHRVLAARQRIGGFSADPRWKRLLLEREGVLLKF